MKLSDMSGYLHFFSVFRVRVRVRGEGLGLGRTSRKHFQRDMIWPTHKHRLKRGDPEEIQTERKLLFSLRSKRATC